MTSVLLLRLVVRMRLVIQLVLLFENFKESQESKESVHISKFIHYRYSPGFELMAHHQESNLKILDFLNLVMSIGYSSFVL